MASNVSITGVTETMLKGGFKVIQGGVGIGQGPGGAYDTTATNMILSNYFKSSTRPYVSIAPTGGYVFNHDGGTAVGGIVKAYYVDATGANAAVAMGEVANAVNVNQNAVFIAFGQPF